MADRGKLVGNLKGPAPWTTPVDWQANTDYVSKAPASCVKTSNGVYVCTTDHKSTTSFDASKFVQIITPAQTAAATKGDQGERGACVYSGSGAPSAAIVSVARPGFDSYYDLASGDTYGFE